MRTILTLLLVASLLVACGSDRVDREADVGIDSDVDVGADEPFLEEVPLDDPNSTVPPDPRAVVPVKPDASTVIASGSFVKKSRPVTGSATIKGQGGLLTLEIAGFSVERGPELHLLLATDESGTSVVDLGELPSYSSYLILTVPPGTDIATYDTLLLWSVGYKELYGSATLS